MGLAEMLEIFPVQSSTAFGYRYYVVYLIAKYY